MNNISWRHHQLNLLTVQAEQSLNLMIEKEGKENDQPDKIAIYDECGDTLWDNVLAQDKQPK